MSKIKELSVKELFASDTYMIPLYQRNYAWGKTEIDQLIQDIWDYCRNDKKKDKPYYIGSLVVAKRGDGCYEVIDGQQRHTTLSILLAVLKNEFENCGNIDSTNLSFEIRDLSTRTLKEMYNGQPKEGEKFMLEAYEHCLNKLQGVKQKNKDSKKSVEVIDVNNFYKYFLGKVKILRTEVPEGTDLNHYFEIMNNRGEQLEKHEVLKARFMEALSDNPQDQAGFAKIWDACADMNRYVVMGFDASKHKEGKASEREKLFGENLDAVDFNLAHISATDHTGDGIELESLLTGDFVETDDKSGRKNEGERFSSTIDFPNFLLHVLRLERNDTTPLDDKQLLSEFDKYDKKNAMSFIQALLEYRFLFDRYVLKREHDESKDGKWCIKRRKTYKNSASDSYVNAFDDESLNHQLVMLQSMLHVSYPTRNYKYWLNDTLAYLHENKYEIKADAFLGHLEKLSDRIFFGRFAGKSKEYDEILESEECLQEIQDNLEETLTYAKGIHNFVFNRLDYLLWTKRNKWLTNNDKKAKGFKFTFKSSVEHVSPQTPDEDNSMENTVSKGVLDTFGNLALISHESNSSFSNKTFKEKREAFLAKKQYESLKLALIYANDSWDDGSARDHQEEMIEVLCGYWQKCED